MWVEQAVYGEVNGGHALRAASGDRQFALGIASRLDLPDNAPPGVSWSPYVSGFTHGEHYVLARTFADADASRSGMVLAHTLIMPIAELIQFKNLKSLFERLITSVDQVAVPAGFNLEEDESQPEGARDLVSAANALVSRGSGPVVRLGTEGFESLVISLWANLWPEARATFNFRLSFGPADIVEAPAPALVCTPVALSGRWSRYRILNCDDQNPSAASASFLAGVVDPTPLLEFAREIGADLRHLSQLPLLERTQMLYSGGDGFDDVLTLVRLMERLSPDPSAGTNLKKVITARLSDHIASAAPLQIHAMRNITLSGFPETSILWREIERWFTAQSFEPVNDESMTQMIAAATSRDTAAETWSTATKCGMIIAARINAQYLPHAVWRWISMRPDLVEAILGLLPTEGPVEIRLASATPNQMDLPLVNTVLRMSLARQWFAVHGAVLSVIDKPIEAARKQIAVDRNVADSTGVTFALRSASPAQLLECAFQLGDERLIGLAADAIVANPRVFSDSRCSEISEQKVWDAALLRNGELWQAPHDPFAARNSVLNGFIKGDKVHMPLIESLARTPLADLCDFPLREQLWTNLKATVGCEYLQATAAGWIEWAAKGKLPFRPDVILMSEILSGTDLDASLYDAGTEFFAGVQIIQALEGFNEQRCLAWFRILISRDRAFPKDDMEELGRLVLMRSWRRVVEEMVAQYRINRSDIKPALRICSSMLDFFTRWRLGLSVPTATEKWEWLVELAAELYPSGPDQDELWSRAGGKNSDLPKNGNGRSIWRTVINQTRNGRGPSLVRLLCKMMEDYPSNDQLRFFAKDPDVTGHR